MACLDNNGIPYFIFPEFIDILKNEKTPTIVQAIQNLKKLQKYQQKQEKKGNKKL